MKIAPIILYMSRTHLSGIASRRRAGYSFLLACNYNQERKLEFFNNDDYYARHLTWQDSLNARHRLSAAGTYELPLGKGRRFISTANPVVSAVFGGWSTSNVLWLDFGDFLRFGQMIAEGAPRIDNPTRAQWFKTAVFKRPEPFTPHTNPLQYSGLTGPTFWQLDSTVSKMFPVTERFNLEFKLEAYNLTDSLFRLLF